MQGKARFNNKTMGIGNVDFFVVEAVHTLSHAEFENFSDSLLESYPFIAERADSLGVDEQDRCRCLLILDEDDDNGILVHSAGYDYARYTSYYPNAKMHLKNEIRQVAEAIVRDRFGDTENGSWIVGFDDIKEHFDLTVSPNNGIGTLLLEELEGKTLNLLAKYKELNNLLIRENKNLSEENKDLQKENLRIKSKLRFKLLNLF